MTSSYAPISLEDQAPKPYSFQYGVKDDYAKTNFAHTESQDAQVSFFDSQLSILAYFFRVRWKAPMWLLFPMEGSRPPPTQQIISMDTLLMSPSKESLYILQRRGLLLNCYTFSDFVKKLINGQCKYASFFTELGYKNTMWVKSWEEWYIWAIQMVSVSSFGEVIVDCPTMFLSPQTFFCEKLHHRVSDV